MNKQRKPVLCEFCGDEFPKRGDLTQHRKDCPQPGDERLQRTCTRCQRVRDWTVAVCRCGCPEYSLPADHEGAA